MCNLLAEGYRRLFKGKRFYIVMAVMAAIPALFALLYSASNSFMEAASRQEGEAAEIFADMRSYADDLLFSHTGVMVLLVGITAGMLIVQDFRNNTIRNKIIVGHSRTEIYLANLIVSLTVMMIYEAVYLVVAIAFGGLLLGFRDFPNTDIIVNMLLVLPIEMAMTSLIVFLCTSMKNVGGFVLSISMHYIVSMFSLALLLLHKHPKIMEIVKEAVPSYQMDLIGNGPIPEHWLRMILFMFGITLISTIGGILIFKKSDLK